MMNLRCFVCCPQSENCTLPHRGKKCRVVHHSKFWRPMSQLGLVSRVTPVHTAMRNCTRDEGRPFEVGNQVLISNHRKLLWAKATVVNVAEKPEQDSGRYD